METALKRSILIVLWEERLCLASSVLLSRTKARHGENMMVVEFGSGEEVVRCVVVRKPCNG